MFLVGLRNWKNPHVSSRSHVSAVKNDYIMSYSLDLKYTSS